MRRSHMFEQYVDYAKGEQIYQDLLCMLQARTAFEVSTSSQTALLLSSLDSRTS